MRLKSVKCVCLAFIVVLLLYAMSTRTSIFIKYTSGGYKLKQEAKFNIFDDLEDQFAMPYPTKSKNETIPTKSPEQIRELMLKYGARGAANLEERLPGLPDQPFGPESFDPDDKLKLEANALKPEDLDPAPRLAGLPTVMPKIEGENVISMTLYGSVLRYTMGAIKNAELVKQNFPGWKLRLYTETPKEDPKYGIVPQTVIDRLRVLGAEIYYMEPEDGWIPPMMWRFLVADDDYIDRFIVRDTDSRLTERDAAAVYEWIKSDLPFNCIRDHPSHASYAISGGMWGGKPKELYKILHKTWRNMLRGLRKDYFEDMEFLNKYIWPKVQNHTYCSDSVSCDAYPNAHPFPIPRYGYEHVGQVVSEHELGRPVDISILRQAGDYAKCVPRGYNRLGLRKGM